MKFVLFSFAVLTMVGIGDCIGADAAGALRGPVRIVTTERGVVPSGTWLVVRTKDVVSTRKALRGTVYDATVAADVLDQDERVLIPKESPVELAVRSISYLGPGGAGMSELTLDIRAVTVNGARFPIETETGRPNAGGLVDGSHTPRWSGDGDRPSRLLTSGPRINVPSETPLAFQLADPIRLRGYSR
jgi:hypothetical protein